MTAITEPRTIRLGRLFYALGIIGLGCQHFYNGDFVAVILPSLPASLPQRYFWVCVAGFGLVFTGGAIAIGKGARAAAIVLGAALAAVVVLRDVPSQGSELLHALGAWTNTLKALTLAGGACVAAASLPAAGTARWDRRLITWGCCAMAVTVVAFGAEHFVYAKYVVPMVPSWVPGPLFWTYFCGVALIAAGAGMLLRIRARLAAGLLGAMIFTWLLVLHLPWAIRDPHTDQGNQWTSVFEALSFSGTALMLSRLLPKKTPPAVLRVQASGS